MPLGSNQSDERLRQIGSIATAEQLGSILFFAHTGLFLLGCLIGAVFADAWWIAAFSMLYVVVFTAEKSLARWAFATRSRSFYPAVLAVLCLRALTYNALVVLIWSMDGDLFKFGALALLVSAAINVMVFHATHFPIIVCTVAPIWGAFSGIAALFVYDLGVSVPSILAVTIAIFVTPYLLLAVSNVHERNRLHEKARLTLDQSHKQELLGRLVAGVAHDFSNILSVSLANAEMIQDNNPSEKTKRHAQEIMRASERGASLVDQLLSFGSRPTLLPKTHDVSAILKDFRLMVSRVFPETIMVISKVADDTTNVVVDRNQLEVALLNLAVNARDAMPNGGRLDVVVDTLLVSDIDGKFGSTHVNDGLYVRFVLQDNGSGMSKEVQDRILDPFFTTKEFSKGSGLGLSMVERFASESGGAILVDSEPDQGTTITLLLPKNPQIIGTVSPNSQFRGSKNR